MYLTTLACSDPPEGRARWTLRLLAQKTVESGLGESLSNVAVYKRLKKQTETLAGKIVAPPQSGRPLRRQKGRRAFGLNAPLTHTSACLYEAFAPARARAIAAKLQWHYTPEHGSWLNMAKCELSVLGKQCFNRRLADATILEREASAWEHTRNGAKTQVNWHFMTDDARVKLKHLYPKVLP